MYNIENLLSDEKHSFQYQDKNFILSKIRFNHINLSPVELCYYCLKLNQTMSIECFEKLTDNDFISKCYDEIQNHNFFDGDRKETELFIKMSSDECKGIANLLIDTNIGLSNSFDNFTYTQSLIFNHGVEIISKERNKEDNNNMNTSQLIEYNKKFRGP